MFYHIKLTITGMTSWLERNMTRDEILVEFACPYLNLEVTMWDGDIFNMASIGHAKILETERPVDSDWPLPQQAYIKEGEAAPSFPYEYDQLRKLEELAKDVTAEMYREAIGLIASGKYRELRKQLLEDVAGHEVFFICPFGSPEIDHNYEFVIKPVVEKNGFGIRRADEFETSQTITETIVRAIHRARFVVADLTEARPNCYYEVGYAHATGKPVVILAKTGTDRHFDLAVHNWTYWDSYTDLKTKLERRIEGVVRELGELRPAGPWYS